MERWRRLSGRGKIVAVAGTLAALLVIGAIAGQDESDQPASEPESTVAAALGDTVGEETSAAETTTGSADAAEPATTGATGEATPTEPDEPEAETFDNVRVIDGDTLELSNGRRVRLLQIDAPEAGEECYADRATAELRAILDQGAPITLEADPNLDDVDQFDRLLRYVHMGSMNVNVQLVKRGAVGVWFFEGDRGKYAERLEREVRSARQAGRGLWGACPGTELNTAAGVATTFPVAEPEPEQEPEPSGGEDCQAGYDPCLPIVGDLDCADIRAMGAAPVTVTGSDPYRLDGDGDGVGCE
jgi:endonuclease YncB( thermonuclease family)